MPAKKKSAAKKASTKKVANKSAPKKSTAKKSTPKVAKKATTKVSKKTTKSKKEKATAQSIAFTAKQQTRISLSMDEIRELLKKRAKEEAELEKENKKKTPVVTTKRIDAGEPLEVKNSRHNAASLDDILGLGISSAPQQKVPRKWKRYYDLLVQLRDEVRAEVNQHSNDTLKRSQKEDGGDVVTSSDAGTDTFDRDFALNLLSSEQEALKEIEDAINRIYRGTYGVCEETNEPINEERLEAVPFTRFSLEGKKLREMNSYRKVQRAGAFLNDVNSEKITFGDDDGDN